MFFGWLHLDCNAFCFIKNITAFRIGPRRPIQWTATLYPEQKNFYLLLQTAPITVYAKVTSSLGGPCLVSANVLKAFQS